MVIVFDVNGTLLDTSALEPPFHRIFGANYSVREWFTELIQYSMATTLAGGFREFADLAIAVLQMAAAARDVRLSRSDVRNVRNTLQSLPPFPDVQPALARLRDAGYRLAALSNSATGALQNQLRNAGLDQYFERAISVAEVRKYKPAPDVYRHAAGVLGVATGALLMIAAHPWDLFGAANADCRTALIERPCTAPFPGAVPPDYIASGLDELTDRILEGSVRGMDERSRAGLWILAAGLIAAGGIAGALLRKGSPRPQPQPAD